MRLVQRSTPSSSSSSLSHPPLLLRRRYFFYSSLLLLFQSFSCIQTSVAFASPPQASIPPRAYPALFRRNIAGKLRSSSSSSLPYCFTFVSSLLGSGQPNRLAPSPCRPTAQVPTARLAASLSPPPCPPPVLRKPATLPPDTLPSDPLCTATLTSLASSPPLGARAVPFALFPSDSLSAPPVDSATQHLTSTPPQPTANNAFSSVLQLIPRRLAEVRTWLSRKTSRFKRVITPQSAASLAKYLGRGVDISHFDVRGDLRPPRCNANPVYLLRLLLLLHNYLHYGSDTTKENTEDMAHYLPPPSPLAQQTIDEIESFFSDFHPPPSDCPSFLREQSALRNSNLFSSSPSSSPSKADMSSCVSSVTSIGVSLGQQADTNTSFTSEPPSPFSARHLLSQRDPVGQEGILPSSPRTLAVQFYDYLSRLISNTTHPVLRLIYIRKITNSTPLRRQDPFKLALAIEGGGMRGCVAAGMAIALHHMGFADCVDVVYGSSAGSLVGSYFISRQIPYEGTQVYYDWLPAGGKKFIDLGRLGRMLGFGFLGDGDVRDFLQDRLGRPLLNLDYLLKYIVQSKQPLDWHRFQRNNQRQPLKIIASGLYSQRSVILDAEHSNFRTLPELCECIRASMLLPGVAGPVVRLSTPGSNVQRLHGPVFSDNKMPRFQKTAYGVLGEPMADALVFEPIPYRSALAENNTHVLVLRTRPDGLKVGRIGGIAAWIEQWMSRRFLQSKNNLRAAYEHMRRRGHRRIYMEDMLRLNSGTNDMATVLNANGAPCHLFAIALPKGEKEVSRTSNKRTAIYNGVRGGFAQVFENLAERPASRTKGWDEARKVFSDERLQSYSAATEQSQGSWSSSAEPYDDSSLTEGTVTDLLRYADSRYLVAQDAEVAVR